MTATENHQPNLRDVTFRWYDPEVEEYVSVVVDVEAILNGESRPTEETAGEGVS